MTSIIVTCWNQREFTGLCIQALFGPTRPAWDRIAIGKGSTDDTVADLAGKAAGNRPSSGPETLAGTAVRSEPRMRP